MADLGQQFAHPRDGALELLASKHVAIVGERRSDACLQGVEVCAASEVSINEIGDDDLCKRLIAFCPADSGAQRDRHSHCSLVRFATSTGARRAGLSNRVRAAFILQQHTRPGMCTPQPDTGSRGAGALLSRGVGAPSLRSPLRRGAHANGRGVDAPRLRDLISQDVRPGVMPFPGALKPASLFRELPAGRAERTGLNCSFYQSLKVRPFGLHGYPGSRPAVFRRVQT